jgi:hypothetical protein
MVNRKSRTNRTIPLVKNELYSTVLGGVPRQMASTAGYVCVHTHSDVALHADPVLSLQVVWLYSGKNIQLLHSIYVVDSQHKIDPATTKLTINETCRIIPKIRRLT